MTDWNGNIAHHVWGPVPLHQSATFAVDILFYMGPDGLIYYRLVGGGASNLWPTTDPHSMIDGDGPENVSKPIMIMLQVEGNVQEHSQVTYDCLVAKELQ
jgi:hypothetical protein